MIKKNSKLSFEDTVEIMARRRNPESEITNKELEEMENAAEDNQKAARKYKEAEKIRQTLSNTRVPVHGNLRVEEKDNEALRFLGVNINSMSFWQRDNYKTDRPKFIVEKYGVDEAGLQEVCINWSELKASQTITSILRVKLEKNQVCCVTQRKGNKKYWPVPTRRDGNDTPGPTSGIRGGQRQRPHRYWKMVLVSGGRRAGSQNLRHNSICTMRKRGGWRSHSLQATGKVHPRKRPQNKYKSAVQEQPVASPQTVTGPGR